MLDDVEGEAEYERLPRKQVATDNNRKMMLPIKTKHGVVQRVLEDGAILCVQSCLFLLIMAHSGI